jgi:putative DNA primase/helicase
MQSYEFEARVDELKRRAHGQWADILRLLGIDEKILNKRNQPCPMCGGTDRFQYTDKYGEGNYHCRHCGPGGGLKLLQGCLGWDFGTTLKHVEECVGSVTTVPYCKKSGPSPEKMKKLAKRIWDEAVPVATGDEVDRYLNNRGLNLREYPKTLRFHPCLGYYEKDPSSGKAKRVRNYPAMLACIQGTDGHAVTLHRTYLQDGKKALGRQSKKVLSAGINGAAVRLGEATDELAVTEGIETALAVYRSTGKPVWAAISAGNMEKLWIPESVRRICVYADNDADSEFDGPASAFILARRLKKEEKTSTQRHIEVFVPKFAGKDWADVWFMRLANAQNAA